MSDQLPTSVRAEASRLLEQITPGEWKLWNGFGPGTDGFMRVERIGPGDPDAWRSIQTQPESPDIRGTKADLEFVASAPRLLRALLAEGPDPETITRLRQWQAEYKRQAEIRLPSQLENSAWQIVSDLLAGLAASQENGK
jgi:hypothetical protein